MSEVRLIRRKEEWGGFVQTDILPAEGGCNLLCLTDRQVAIIRAFVFPAVRWPTRWVQPFQGDLCWVDVPTQLALIDEIDDLDLEVNGGHNVPCESLADALGTLITIANSAGSVGSVLANIPDEDWLPTDAETPPEPGVPPEGFDTWAQYDHWKCQAAWAVWHEVDRVMTMLEGFYGLEVTASVIIPTIFAFTSVSWVAVPISGIAILVVSILAMVAVWGSAVLIMDQMRTWWSDHQDAIVCQLYNSGDAATALAAIGDNIEDAIQAIEWGALLPFAGPLGDALGTVIGVFQNNSLVNPLFKLITGVALIEVECPCAGPQGLWWHFDSSAQDFALEAVVGGGTTAVGEWTDAEPVPCPTDYSPGCLSLLVTRPPAGTFDHCYWLYTFPEAERIALHTGDYAEARYLQNSASGAKRVWMYCTYVEGGGFQAYSSIKNSWQTLHATVLLADNGKHILSVALGIDAPAANTQYALYWDGVQVMP